MSLKDKLEKEVRRIFSENWTTREGKQVPSPEDIALEKNDAVHFERATVLYADLSGSTALVDTREWWFSAEIYRAYLRCAADVIRSEGGTVTAYDGDRVMGVFIGGSQTTCAARCGLKINYAVTKIVNPELKKQYPNENYVVKQVVGIDTTETRVARTGVRGDNDLVWVGKAANYAAKLTDLSMSEKTFVTDRAFSRMHNDVKYGGDPERNMWTGYKWAQKDNMQIYGSTWWWSFS
ncbi:adenylate/guanylate cyclase domain-containing protein [Pontixanthobacter aestiaquae]|uniref:Adenylate/guanylate cyclase domain-containing protein n=1 Tax=Pontixanthobacter aestiaquae TaxID=1509367 RepID=A0A844ZAM2_9SPHN|nr:adenylate/guanylate cyclase domain-containing protein [Pontixanthobacter aestiaquae]MDN3645080.1 adenylate/guanylate cyclase domain-containing protein [Pontixanthobacter aestiaquae]MXO83920.1 adenylate/guanylate cyclase domain-containing protein [Pontixanthobacter aestiaquae]